MKPSIDKYIALALCLAFFQSATAQQKTVNVGIVIDGPWERNDEIQKMTKTEIIKLTEGEFDVRFPEDKIIAADWTLAGIRAAIDKSLTDPEVDFVIAMGVIASGEISNRGALPKPVIAPFVIDAELQGLPAKNGASGIANLNYLSLPSHIARDIKIFREIVPFTNITVLVNHLIDESIPQFNSRIKVALAPLKVQARLVPVEKSIDSALRFLNDNTEAVYLAPLMHIPPGDFDRLVAVLRQKKIPSFSTFGVENLKRGIMATLTHGFFPKITRRIALNFQRILLGEKPEELPVSFAIGERLMINMEVARDIGVSPPFTILTEAELINEHRAHTARTLSLTGVMREAVDKNLDLQAEKKRLAAGNQQVRQALALLLPQISISSRAMLIDKDRAEASFGAQAQRTWQGSAVASQLIYSEKAWSNRAIQNHLQRMRTHELEQMRLNIAQEGANAFLNVLRAKTFERVQRENLRRTRSNLELAQVREAIGYSGRSEVFRWESEVALDRKDVIQANAQRNLAEIALNRVLHAPPEASFATREVDLNNPALATSRHELLDFMDDPVSFKRTRQFMVEEGLSSSPEIAILDAVIAAKQRELASANRAFWSPALALQADIGRIFKEGGAGTSSPALSAEIPFSFPQADKSNWSIALNLSLPLFEGGGRFAQKTRAGKELQALKADRQSVLEKIEQRIRSALHIAGASRAGIKLSSDAANAAQKNLELVTDAYTRGALSILDLLDAQNAALIAKLGAANAIYDFLIDLAEVERSSGKFYLFALTDERDAWIKRLQKHGKTSE